MGKTFIGRSKSFSQLKDLTKKNSPSLVVIRGRRRIGKSRLAEEFSKLFDRAYLFSGLPPEKKTTQVHQKKEFIRQLHEQRIPSTGSQDWGDLFKDLADYCGEGPALIVLDEITWMGSLDPTFLGKLKIAWDKHFKQNPQLILIISGSDSAWIEKNLLSQTGFFGRISLRLSLEELPLQDCIQFWRNQAEHIAPYEFLKVLSVTGGVPRYLEEIQPHLSAEENIYRLCFQPEGILFNEFDDIFADLFKKRQKHYKEVVLAISEGHKTVDAIANYLGRKRGGDLSEQLNALSMDGFIAKDYSWNFKTEKPSKKIQYRIKDNYLRFYLHHILPHHNRIQNHQMSSLPQSWESIMGLQFETLVLNNRKSLHRMIQIKEDDIVMSNPYFQSKTTRQEACQIDYLVQTKFSTLYACEIKFRKHPVGTEVMDEMREKLAKLTLPKYFSVKPILIHVNGVTDKLLAKNYFAHVVDFSELIVIPAKAGISRKE